MVYPIVLALPPIGMLGLVILAILAVTAFFGAFLPWLMEFRRELRFINMEIRRNHGRERAHWEKKKRRLWLSLLPFFHYR